MSNFISADPDDDYLSHNEVEILRLTQWLNKEVAARKAAESTIALLAKERDEAREVLTSGRHPYTPDVEHPQFCRICGYHEHETLQHARPPPSSLLQGGTHDH